MLWPLSAPSIYTFSQKINAKKTCYLVIQFILHLSVGEGELVPGHWHGWSVVEVEAEFLLHADQLDATEDVGNLVLQIIVRNLVGPRVSRLVLWGLCHYG